MAIISFEDYVVDKSFYQINSNFEGGDDNGQLKVPITFSAEVGVDKSQEKAYVIINIELGNSDTQEDQVHVPFICQVSIRGIFSYSSEDFETDEDLKNTLGGNAVAILYPYVRTHVSTLTNLSNQFPAYTLPVMNFAETIRENDLISFIGFE
ncbi:protein-export chaperone SecB [Streptococcus thermophilus]|uniref:protein-export chaperone SecB n=1 Tax=Streptococcus thermophilus TaxID=1308 RepID=UPI003A80EDF9